MSQPEQPAYQYVDANYQRLSDLAGKLHFAAKELAILVIGLQIGRDKEAVAFVKGVAQAVEAISNELSHSFGPRMAKLQSELVQVQNENSKLRTRCDSIQEINDRVRKEHAKLRLELARLKARKKTTKGIKKKVSRKTREVSGK